MSKQKILLIVSLPLCLLVAGLGFWIMTEPQQGAGPAEEQHCREYLDQLELLNRYKLFWTFIQRRLAYSSCITRQIEERQNQPSENLPPSN